MPRKRPLNKAERAALAPLVGRAWFSPPCDFHPEGIVTWVHGMPGPGGYCFDVRWANAGDLAFMSGGQRHARTFLDDLRRGSKGGPIVEVQAPVAGDSIAWVGVFGARSVYLIRAVDPLDTRLILDPDASPSYAPELPTHAD